MAWGKTMDQPQVLPESNRYLQEQFAHTGDAVVVVDAEQRILLWNEAAALLLGYRGEEVLGKHCYAVMKTRDCDGALICCQDCPSIREARKRHWASHQTVLAETKAGKPICLSIASFSLLSAERKFKSLAHVFWEVENTTAAATATEAVEAPRPPPLHSMEVSPVLFLSPQEQNVLRCLAAGMDTQAIARLLFISPTTVRNHIQHTLRKLGVHSRLEAVALANRHHHRA